MIVSNTIRIIFGKIQAKFDPRFKRRFLHASKSIRLGRGLERRRLEPLKLQVYKLNGQNFKGCQQHTKII